MSWYWGNKIDKNHIYYKILPIFVFINLLGVIYPHYNYYKRDPNPKISTYSHMIKQDYNKYIFFITWFIGFFVKLKWYQAISGGKGLDIVLKIMFVSWIGGQLFTSDDDEYNDSFKNKLHIFFAAMCFLSFGYHVGIACKSKLFVTMFIITLCLPRQLFPIFENILMYLIAFLSNI